MGRILEPPANQRPDSGGPTRDAAGDRLGLNRSQRMGLALLGTAMLAACGLWLFRSAREPLAEPIPAAEGEPSYRVNVNEADWPVLALVPGLGDALSQRIVEYRRANGPLRSLDELTKVSGIGSIKLQEIRPYLRLGDDPAGGARGEPR